MQLALEQARFALESGEVPVGCIFYHLPSQTVVAKSHNLTNQTKNVYFHLLLNIKATTHCEINCINQLSNENKINMIQECVLYVTVEPCLMCAHALNLVKIMKVKFGCENDKFGGNGSILSLNKFQNAGYQVEQGILKNDAIKLLQQFYEHGNEKAPENKRQRKI
ncbi:adenosine deaminase [Stylonychia lemnae]|uniref:Adenosine deaminase n=1 Tax=Stylonychia lemnae TaxID=5949 RepID=A0A077ZZ61_STYLE|nr:adenosine deaminase [Stylonychia lemnae]|eukprot:CDW75215.1 adenosine deaminase [Stylonychia lemnae]